MANFGNQGGRKANQAASGPPAVVGQFEIVEPKCKVCQSPHRREVDMLISTGWSQTDVRKHFNQLLGENFFTKDSMSRHVNRHLSVLDAASRRIIEARARQFGIDVDEVEGSILTKAAVLDTIIQTGIGSLQKGDTVVEARDILQAVQVLDKFESEWKETAIDEIMAEFRAFTEAVKEIVGEEQYDAIFAAFERRLDAREGPALKPLPRPAAEPLAEVTDERFED